MDSLQTFLAAATLLAPLVAAAAIAASGLQKGRWTSRLLAKWGAGVSFCSAAAALVRVASGLTGEPALSLGTWLSTGPGDAVRITLGLQFDAYAAGLAAVMSLTTWCALAQFRPERPEGQADRVLSIGASLLLFSSLGVVLSTNLVELYVFWQIAAVAGYLMSLAHAETALRGGAAKKFLVAQRIADGFLLFAVFALAAGFRTLDFQELFGKPELWGQLTGPKALLVEFIGLCLLGACVGRCGLIPLIASTGELAAEPALLTVLVEGVCLMPAGVLLLIRCHHVLDAGMASSSFAAFLGAASAFALAVCAWGADDVRRSAGYACASVFGVLVFGLATPRLASEHWGLFLLLAYLPSSALILGAFATAPQEIASGQTPLRHVVPQQVRSARWPLAIAMMLLFSGICGQGRMLAAAFQLVGSSDQESSRAATLAAILVAAAQFIAASAMMRAFLTGRAAEHDLRTAPSTVIETSLVGEEPAFTGSRSSWILAVLACCGTLIGLVAVAGNGPHVLESIFGCLPALSGFVAGWWQSQPAQSRLARRFSNGVLARLGRNRFYFDALLFLFIVLPVRGLAQLARFFDWFFVDGLVSGTPASLVESAAVLLEPIQRRSVAFYLLSMAFGTGLLAGMIVWLRN